MRRYRLPLIALLLGALFLDIAHAAENHPPRKAAPEHPRPAAGPAPVPPRHSAGQTARPVPARPDSAPAAIALVGTPTAVPAGTVTGCWLDAHPFRGLTTGVVDYCRGHLGYAPGAPDCYTFADEVCTVFLPGSAAWTETRRALGSAVFPCPDAPEPPVCPRLTWQ